MRKLLLVFVLAFTVSQPALPQGNPKDDKIYDDVRRRLADDADVRGAAIEVTVKNGAVVISGRVRDEAARQKAPRLVKKVKGVTTVENKLKLFSEN
jgi:osmotically-inducible protein OsmY